VCFVLVSTDTNFPICQFSWPEKLSMLCHASVCLHNPPGSFLHLGVDIIYKVLEGKPERSILLWRPKYGWKNPIELDLKK
jgi:hypothetical protein